MRAGQLLEHFARQMLRRALARRPKSDGVRVGLGRRHHVLHRLVGLVRAHQQHVRDAAQQDHRRKVAGGVVVDAGQQRRVDRVRGNGAQQQRVAVRLGARHCVGAQHAARPTLVFHQHGLAQAGAQFLRDHPAQDVGRATRRERHHQGDRLASRPIVRGVGGCAQGGQGQRGQGAAEQGKCLQSLSPDGT
ncbi:hypothetical protein D3C71_1485050 [compost metagenome]